MDFNTYLFRRQFILGSKFIDKLHTWKREKITEKLFLTVHPDLELTKVNNKNDFMILMGFILDPFYPHLNNEQIIRNIIMNSNTADDVFENIESTGGRYILIVKIKNNFRIFSDPAGFRQIFYFMDDDKDIWCASQPSIISEQFNSIVNEDIRNDLYSLPLFKYTSEYWFPGKITLYQNIFHLTPNHYLDLENKNIVRFWPRRNLRKMSFEECIESAPKLLKGLLISASNRFDLAFAVTCGFDTRVLLAASKEILDKMHFITQTNTTVNENSPDIAIPRKILKSAGVKHHIAYYQNKSSFEFENVFRRNVTLGRTKWLLNSYAFNQYFQKINKEMVVVNGVCSEIARNFYLSIYYMIDLGAKKRASIFPRFFKLNGDSLATLVDMAGSKIAAREFNEWLNSAKKCENYGYNLLDLFYWENRNANWAAMAYSEYDIAFESYSPFNCRGLLEKMLGVDQEERLPPINKLHRGLIKRMWPEILDYPINPPESIREWVTVRFGSTEFYSFLRSLKFVYRHFSKKRFLNRSAFCM